VPLDGAALIEAAEIRLGAVDNKSKKKLIYAYAA